MAETISLSGDLGLFNLKVVYDKLPNNSDQSVLEKTNSPSITITISASDNYTSANQVDNSKPAFQGFFGHNNAGYFNSASAANSANLLDTQADRPAILGIK